MAKGDDLSVERGSSPFGPPTTSGHLGSGNFVDFPRKRQRSCLVFSPTCFASRGPRVRVPPRPPNIRFQ